MSNQENRHVNEFKNKFKAARAARNKDDDALPVQPFLRVLNLVKPTRTSQSNVESEITAEQVLTEVSRDLHEISCEDFLKKWE
jgi:hypothetical protein